MATTTVRCPNCGVPAEVRLHHDETKRVRVEGFECPSGCAVDDESVRQIVGTSDF